MSRVTRFAARDPGPAARMSGFMAHLRANGLRLGVAETELALKATTHVKSGRSEEIRRALKAVCTGCREENTRFDALFDAYWMDAGRVRSRIIPVHPKASQKHDHIDSSRDATAGQADGDGIATTPDDDRTGRVGEGTGKLIASQLPNLSRQDLRKLIRPEEIAEAERVALRLGAALQQKRTRRRRAARRGARLDFRRTIRQSLPTGGEPIALFRKARLHRPYRITILCDVSGSMTAYSRVFLAFVAGLMRGDPDADAYLFHTRLLRITEALRDHDAMRAMGRLSLMAEGFGGGSEIGTCLHHFATTYARRLVNGRNAVVVLSDGYDTGPPDLLANALARLRRRGCRIIWLNPLKSWRDYEPVAAGMAAALPYLDLFAAANTLEDLSALEKELGQL